MNGRLAGQEIFSQFRVLLAWFACKLVIDHACLCGTSQVVARAVRDKAVEGKWVDTGPTGNERTEGRAAAQSPGQGVVCGYGYMASPGTLQKLRVQGACSGEQVEEGFGGGEVGGVARDEGGVTSDE